MTDYPVFENVTDLWLRGAWMQVLGMRGWDYLGCTPPWILLHQSREQNREMWACWPTCSSCSIGHASCFFFWGKTVVFSPNSAPSIFLSQFCSVVTFAGVSFCSFSILVLEYGLPLTGRLSYSNSFFLSVLWVESFDHLLFFLRCTWFKPCCVESILICWTSMCRYYWGNESKGFTQVT